MGGPDEFAHRKLKSSCEHAAGASPKKASYRKGGGRGVRDSEGLTPRQAEFVMRFIADPKYSATAAARSAGFSGPDQAANRLMRVPAVKAAIARRLRPHIEALEITAERVLQGLAEMAFGSVLDFGRVTPDGHFQVDLTKMDRLSAGAIASIETETYVEGRGAEAKTVKRTILKMADRRPALEALGRHLRILGSTSEALTHQPTRLILMYAPPPK